MKFLTQRIPSPSSMCFDHEPADSELTCLLDAPRSLGMANLKTVETGGMFRVIPAKLPTFWIMVPMVLGAAALTAGMVYMFSIGHEQASFIDVGFWIVIASWWLFVIPVCLVAMVVVNHKIAKTDDFLRVDTTRRVLELCRAGRKLRAADIVAFTELTRWLRGIEGWCKTQQTGVLVRTANGGTELLALADGMRRLRLADRLASIFQVPVRRIKLSWSESRALNDC